MLERRSEGSYLCLAGPARLAAPGAVIRIGDHLQATVIGPSGAHPGGRWVTFDAEDADAAIEAAGDAPLPPYIHETLADPSRYQTLYATGAPGLRGGADGRTALHHAVMERLRDAGHRLGDVAPRCRPRHLCSDPHREHRGPRDARGAVRATCCDGRGNCRDASRGGRVIAVGTTVVRVLETCAADNGVPHAGTGRTRLFIRPGHHFRVVDGLVTNFHQPRSSLLVLLDAFVGEERRRAAYAHALQGEYRFLSLGDCMLCWRAA